MASSLQSTRAVEISPEEDTAFDHERNSDPESMSSGGESEWDHFLANGSEIER